MHYAHVLECHFSPSGTTKEVTRAFVAHLSGEKEELDLVRHPLEAERGVPPDTLLVAAVPVYSGRVPAMCAKQLARLKGQGGPAVALAVYGNRDYEDALLELTDILSEGGFTVIGGGAFIARHSIFPKVAKGRPDERDREAIAAFAAECRAKLESGAVNEPLRVKGNKPYREVVRSAKGSPLQPSADKSCTHCGACARVCPTGAIDPENPPVKKPEACIACAACIAVCPEHSQAFRGFKYHLFSRLFGRKCKERREPEYFV